LEGQKNGVVLSASALVVDEPYGLIAGASAQGGYASASSGGLSSMMGGVVGGVLFNEGGSSSGPAEEGVVIFVTHQNALVVSIVAFCFIVLQIYTGKKCVFYELSKF
jgi:vacuolar protein sorting-associated protein 8